MNRRRLLLASSALCLMAGSAARAQPDGRRPASEGIFASSSTTPTLVLPEGITASQSKVYVGEYNVFQPFDSRILRIVEALSRRLSRTV